MAATSVADLAIEKQKSSAYVGEVKQLHPASMCCPLLIDTGPRALATAVSVEALNAPTDASATCRKKSWRSFHVDFPHKLFCGPVSTHAVPTPPLRSLPQGFAAAEVNVAASASARLKFCTQNTFPSPPQISHGNAPRPVQAVQARMCTINRPIYMLHEIWTALTVQDGAEIWCMFCRAWLSIPPPRMTLRK